ncbi:MAG: VCBS repeat-containing protein [Candidatus Eisenbacteria bacterium]|nr:VCBS repeat-containing protein [Candidatus Eisenbacteria bacterium]
MTRIAPQRFPSLSSRKPASNLTLSGVVLTLALGLALVPTAPALAVDFAPHAVYPTADFPFGVATGDLDGDGYPEIVAVDMDGLTVLPALRDGTFGPAMSYPMEETRTVVVGDFDDDGHDDVVVQRQSQTQPPMAFLRNQGDGTLAAPIPFGTSHPIGGPTIVSDFDEDDALDLAVHDAANGRILVYLGNGDGSFADEAPYTVSGNTYPSDIAAFDADGDGDLDIAFTAVLDDTPAGILWGNGDGTFGSTTSFSTYTVTEVGLAAGDIDGDHDDDLVVLDFSANKLRVYRNDSTGAFSVTEEYSPGISIQLGARPSLADFDLDGDLDVVLFGFSESSVVVFVNDDTGGFAGPDIFSATGSTTMMTIADLDQDYDPDIVVSDRFNHQVAVLLDLQSSPAEVPSGAPSVVDAGSVLRPPTPNPTLGPTTIRLDLPGATAISLAVFDAQGRLVRTLEDGSRRLDAGTTTFEWDGRDDAGREVAGGVYLVRMTTGDEEPRSTRVVVAR